MCGTFSLLTLSARMCPPGKNPLFKSGCDCRSVLVAREEGYKRARCSPAPCPQELPSPTDKNFLSDLDLTCCVLLVPILCQLPKLKRGQPGEGEPPSGEKYFQDAWELRVIYLRKLEEFQNVCFLKPQIVLWSHRFLPGQKLLPWKDVCV